jgi:hypothetical protein
MGDNAQRECDSTEDVEIEFATALRELLELYRLIPDSKKTDALKLMTDLNS